VKIAALVEDAFKSELKGFRTISTTFKNWMRTEKRFLAWSEPITVVNFGQIRKRFPIRTFFVLIDTAIILSTGRLESLQPFNVSVCLSVTTGRLSKL